MQRTEISHTWIFLLSVVAAAVCVAADGAEDTRAPADINALELEKPLYDLGEIMEGRKVEVRVALRNVSDRAVRVLSTRVNCGCLIADKKPLSSAIGPGETREITVALDTAGMRGAFAKSVFINYEAESRGFLRAVLRGRVVNEIYVSPKLLAFGKVTYGYMYKYAVRLTSDVSDKYQITAVTIESGFPTSPNSVPLEEQISYEVRTMEKGGYEIAYSLTPDPTLKSYMATSRIHLRGLKTESVSVMLSWQGVGPVKTYPCAVVGTAEQRFEDTLLMASTREDLPLPPFDVSIDMKNATVDLLEADEEKRVYRIAVDRSDADAGVASGYLILNFHDPKRNFNPEKVAVLVRWH